MTTTTMRTGGATKAGGATKGRGDRVFAWLSMAPALVIVLLLIIVPLGWAVFTSLTNSNGVRYEFVGIDNYVDLLRSAQFWQILLNNVIFLLAVPVVLTLAVVSAILVYERVRGWRFFRIALFLPTVVSTVVVGILFRTLFSLDGPVNQLIRVVGGEPVLWLGEGTSARAVIIIALAWGGFGYGMMVLLSGLSTIDPAVFEAARLDGAGWFRRTGSITIPLLSGQIRFVSVLNVSYTFTSLFGYVFVMTSGGPAAATTTLDYYVYLRAFVSSQFGVASALALILFLIVIALTVVQFRITAVDDGTGS
jgi:ABC-type sugar transport system permease subunit